jgi:hypothetical protein
MAKITVEIESRCLYPSDEKQVSELFDLEGMCEYSDDIESENDFDIEIRSDLDRFTATFAIDTAEQAQTDQRDAAITGTRTDDTTFTRSAGTWVVNALKAYRAWIYNSASPDSGAWHDVLTNSAGTITVESGTLVAGANRVQLQAKTKIRHHIQITPKEDFYGSFFQYKVTKKISSVDGKFKWFGVSGNAIDRSRESEFIVGMGVTDISNGW